MCGRSCTSHAQTMQNQLSDNLGGQLDGCLHHPCRSVQRASDAHGLRRTPRPRVFRSLPSEFPLSWPVVGIPPSPTAVNLADRTTRVKWNIRCNPNNAHNIEEVYVYSCLGIGGAMRSGCGTQSSRLAGRGRMPLRSKVPQARGLTTRWQAAGVGSRFHSLPLRDCVTDRVAPLYYRAPRSEPRPMQHTANAAPVAAVIGQANATGPCHAGGIRRSQTVG